MWNNEPGRSRKECGDVSAYANIHRGREHSITLCIQDPSDVARVEGNGEDPNLGIHTHFCWRGMCHALAKHAKPHAVRVEYRRTAPGGRCGSGLCRSV